MALLGDDGRGYELARKLESHGVWRSWLGDSLYPSFVIFLSSPSSWEAFMRADDSKSRAQIQLQLRARALLFDKASVSLFLSSSSSSSTPVSKLNPNYLQLHGDDVYFTLEDYAQERDGVVATKTAAASKLPTKAGISTGSRYGEKDTDVMSQKFRHEELPETWYTHFFEKYRATKPYRLSIVDRETDRRTPEQMCTYLRILDKHKRRRVAFKEDEINGFGNRMPENASNMLQNSAIIDSDAIDDETSLFPEMMFPWNCVPDSALPSTIRVQESHKVEFNGVLDTLPQVMTRNPIMIERLGIRPELLGMEQRGNQRRGRNGSEGNKKLLGQEQASELTRKVIARMLSNVGFEASSEVPMEVLSQLLSCHMSKLGHILKVLADSYRKQCSAVELLKMFLQTAGYSNLGPLAELVKDGTRNSQQHSQQQMQVIQSQMQSHQQASLRQSQHIQRQMHPQMQPQQQQQMVHPQNLAFQQQQLMRRRQQVTPRPGMNVNMENVRPLVEVKLENPSEFPMDSNPFGTMNARHPQMQQFRQQQQQQIAALSNFHPHPTTQFRQLASAQIPQVQTPNMSTVRAQPVKVEGFQELMGGDASLKHDSEENKLTSPSK
ncbi:hypothetical protein C3L33_01845, partial [Rhododendron williamsianum]